MDPLTHTLVGAALARTPLRRLTPLAGAALIVGANLPDVDVLSFVGGADAAVGFRRGWTHGPLALAVLPVLWTLLLVAFDRRRPRRAPGTPPARVPALLLLTFVGCLTHPLLDWLNTYGVRLLMPFDGNWFYGDAMFIVDPWVWLLLGGAVFLERERRGVPWGWITLALGTSTAILLAPSIVPAAAGVIWFVALALIALLSLTVDRRRLTGTFAVAALAIVTVYVGLLLATTAAGSTWARGELERQGVAGVGRLMVGPRPANPFRWSVVAETPEAYRYGTLRWLPYRELELDPRPVPRPASSPIVDAALAAPQVRGAVNWMRFPFVEIDETADGYTVHILDARYVQQRTTGFGSAVVQLDRELQVRP